MLFVSISFALGGQRKHCFQWNVGLTEHLIIITNNRSFQVCPSQYFPTGTPHICTDKLHLQGAHLTEVISSAIAHACKSSPWRQNKQQEISADKTGITYLRSARSGTQADFYLKHIQQQNGEQKTSYLSCLFLLL